MTALVTHNVSMGNVSMILTVSLVTALSVILVHFVRLISVCVQKRLLVLMMVPVLMVLVHCTTVPVLMGILESTALVMYQSALRRILAVTVVNALMVLPALA